MARDRNKIELMGNCADDPTTHDVKDSESGEIVVRVPLITSEEWKDRDTGEKRSRSERHSLVFFGGLAKIAREYIFKGKQILVDGKVCYNKFTDKEGVERWATDIEVSELNLMNDPKSKGDDARS